MIIKDALNLARKKISALDLSPHQKFWCGDAEVLLAFATKKDKEYLYSHPESKLTAESYKLFSSLIKRRAKGEPVAYLTGHKEFYGLDFEVNKDVLIPRPETELLVDEAIKIIDQKSLTIYKIADIGAGSGNIAISIAKNLPPKNKIKIYATDISQKAIEIAKRNARNHNVKINFLQGDLLEPLPQKVELMVANLPYLTKQQIAINKQQLGYEPKNALNGGKDGLELIKKMLRQAPNYLNPNGQIISEIDPGQAQFFRKNYPKTLFKKDLAGKTRIAIVPYQALL